MSGVTSYSTYCQSIRTLNHCQSIITQHLKKSFNPTYSASCKADAEFRSAEYRSLSQLETTLNTLVEPLAIDLSTSSTPLSTKFHCLKTSILDLRKIIDTWAKETPPPPAVSQIPKSEQTGFASATQKRSESLGIEENFRAVSGWERFTEKLIKYNEQGRENRLRSLVQETTATAPLAPATMATAASAVTYPKTLCKSIVDLQIACVGNVADFENLKPTINTCAKAYIDACYREDRELNTLGIVSSEGQKGLTQSISNLIAAIGSLNITFNGIRITQSVLESSVYRQSLKFSDEEDIFSDF
jgi:hypothetical protein